MGYILPVVYFLMQLIFCPARIEAFVGNLQILKQSALSSDFHLQQRKAIGVVGNAIYASATAKETKATLSEKTIWKVRIQLKNVLTSNGNRVDPLFVLNLQFLEDINYEPPQGTVQMLKAAIEEYREEHMNVDENSSVSNEVKQGMLPVKGGRWKLSEDPNERKDGLWVWGLFKEPLYPFFLLTLQTDEVKLSGPDRLGDSIAPMTLYSQVSHIRDSEAGAVLGSGPVNLRKIETVQADPFGGATVDIYDEINVGQISFQPLRLM